MTAEVSLPNSQLTASLLVPTLLVHMHTALPSSDPPPSRTSSVLALFAENLFSKQQRQQQLRRADTNIDVTSPQQKLFSLFALFAGNLFSNVIRQQQLTCTT